MIECLFWAHSGIHGLVAPLFLLFDGEPFRKGRDISMPRVLGGKESTP